MRLLHAVACLVAYCDNRAPQGMCKKHLLRLSRHGTTDWRPGYRESADERFWYAPTRVNDTGCWIWMGGKNEDGYGTFRKSVSEVVGAHRFSMEQHIGRRLVDDEQALHTCDTPACVNPEHLYVGDIPQNMRDRSRRGRTSRMTGESNPLYGKKGTDHPSFGREVSDETRAKLAAGKVGELNPNFGKTASVETRRKMSEKRKGVPQPSSRRSAHVRYHVNGGGFSEACQFCTEPPT